MDQMILEMKSIVYHVVHDAYQENGGHRGDALNPSHQAHVPDDEWHH
jgi:hypothetical protein